jgi:hypothetical protein
MFLTLSKLLPLLVYPLGLACVLPALGILAWRERRWQTWLVVMAFALLWLGGNRIISMMAVIFPALINRFSRLLTILQPFIN